MAGGNGKGGKRENSKGKKISAKFSLKPWIEVLILVIKNAPSMERFVTHDGKNYKITEYDWSSHQYEIEKFLTLASKIWSCPIIHGKTIDGIWKDFVVLDSIDLRYINEATLQSDTGSEVKAIKSIWDSAKKQRWTDNAILLIYVSPDSNHYKYYPDKGAVEMNVKGMAISRKKFSHLPTDIALIYSNKYPETTAHELGHLFTGMEDHDDSNPLYIMATCGEGKLRHIVKPEWKRDFQNYRYTNKIPLPNLKMPS
jgi:hypothetical protein